MKPEIVIVGAGHGGLIAARKLAMNGFSVTIYERKKYEEVSWDWHDFFNKEIFERVNIPMLDRSEYTIRPNYTFTPPSGKNAIITNISEEDQEISVDRRQFIRILMDRAIEKGVTIKFESNVSGPWIENDKIVGIKLNDENISADLVIDAAGVNSIIRRNLPDSYRIQKNPKRGELFHVYRAYYNKLDGWDGKNPYRLYMGYKYQRGLAWVITREEAVDILIGMIDPLSKEQISSSIEDMKNTDAHLGNELIRGGQAAKLPIRRTLSRFVGDNYVAIGDSAFMTIPIQGSGIEMALTAGDILADILIDLKNNETPGGYSVENLWKFEYDFFIEKGAAAAKIDVLKNFFLTANFKDIDYMFEKQIMKASDIESSVGKDGAKVGIGDMLGRLMRGITKLGVLLYMLKILNTAKQVEQTCLKIPKIYDDKAIDEWGRKVDSYFTEFNKIINKTA